MCVVYFCFFLFCVFFFVFFFQAEDGIRDLVRSRGLGDVYKRQLLKNAAESVDNAQRPAGRRRVELRVIPRMEGTQAVVCLLYTSDAADERSSVDLGGRRIIKKKNKKS